MTDNAQQSPPDPEPIAGIEDANDPDAPGEPDVIEDDAEEQITNAQALEPAENSVSSETSESPSPEQAPSTVALADDASDTAAIVDDPPTKDSTEPQLPDWSNEKSGHRIAVELKHVESEVRRLLENNDTRRKRRLGGTRRWRELEEDILAWKFTGRPNEETLGKLQALIAKRNQLYARLVFLSTVRPGWREKPAERTP